MRDGSESASDDARHAAVHGAATKSERWCDIERRFRLWSFRVYYNKCFATESDPTLRFAKALIASCQGIRDRRLVYEWNRRQRDRHAGRSRSRRKTEQHADAEALST